ncbi:MAG: transcriptional regulator [Betaproteobacteria bacterium]|nr:MAG: transcriptional regulator [Betaproteobacteria bacterium]
MDFDLRLLRHARALAEEGSFARAARTLHLTQPALSRSIQELERRTGMKLFDRLQAGVEPTDLGRGFLEQARELLAHAEALDREVATMRGTGSGRLVVGSGTFPSSIFMAPAVAAFLRKHPAVRLRLVNDNWAALVASLRRRELDFVVAAPPAADESADLDARLLSRVQGRFLVRAGHPLLQRSSVTLTDVANAALLSTSRIPAALVQPIVGARTDRNPGRPVPDVASESPEMMRQIAAATDHIVLSSLSANAPAVERGELVPLPLVDARIGIAFAILKLKARTLSPLADDLIREVVAADVAAAALDRRLASLVADRGRAPTAPSKRRRPATSAAAA